MPALLRVRLRDFFSTSQVSRPLSYSGVMMLASRVLSALSALTAVASEPPIMSAAMCARPATPVFDQFFRNPHFKSIASARNRPKTPDAKAAMDPARLTWRRAAARRPSSRFPNSVPRRPWTPACAATARLFRALTSAAASTRRRMWSAPIATPSTSRQRRNFCSPRSRPSSVMAATPPCARNSLCRSSIA